MNGLESLKILKDKINCPPELPQTENNPTQEGRYERKALPNTKKYYTPFRRKRNPQEVNLGAGTFRN